MLARRTGGSALPFSHPWLATPPTMDKLTPLRSRRGNSRLPPACLPRADPSAIRSGASAMLKLFATRESNCERTRRRFLVEVGAIAPLGLTLPSLLRSTASAAEAAKGKKEVNCILIWTRGGTSHHDTLDPKPEAPADVRGEFN